MSRLPPSDLNTTRRMRVCDLVALEESVDEQTRQTVVEPVRQEIIAALMNVGEEPPVIREASGTALVARIDPSSVPPPSDDNPFLAPGEEHASSLLPPKLPRSAAQLVELALVAWALVVAAVPVAYLLLG